jgi:CO/xanthine dehydrogenase FAD-binding subunit
MLPEFLSLRPETREEAVALLSSLDDAKVLAGGTDLLVKMSRGETHAHLVDVGGIPDLGRIEQGNGVLVIGGAATHRRAHEDSLIRSGAFGLSQACGWVGSPQIRNMGTIGGNLANASPAADSIPPLLIHDARVVLESTGGSRRVGLEDFIVAPYRTSMGGDELLTRIEIEGCEGYREGYRRVAKRAAWAISRLSVAWAIKEADGVYLDVRLAIGSCTPMPFRPWEVEEFLSDKEGEPQVVREAVDMVCAEIRRLSGERPSFVYKMPALRAMLYEILEGQGDERR